MNSTVKIHQVNYLINKIFLTFQSVYPNPETSQYNIHNIQEIRQIYQHIKSQENETHAKRIIGSQSRDSTDI